MSWGAHNSFLKAILHVDGDSFFVACEVALDPSLKGKPVVTGRERGIAAAMSYEAKTMGVTRGMTITDVFKLIPNAIIIPSNYETYSLFSQRMFEIVRRYTPQVEEYSIDECFADLTGLRRPLKLSYQGMATQIKADLQRELNITFSVGLASSKVLAKLGSKHSKPDGLVFIPAREARRYLAETPIAQLWGVGPQTSAYLGKFGIRNALDFADKDSAWVRDHLSKPYQEIWSEIRGNSVYSVGSGNKNSYRSISKTKTFTPASTNRSFVLSQLSKNVENACIKTRRHGLEANSISFFVKTQEFRYKGTEFKLGTPTDMPMKIMEIVTRHFDKIFVYGTSYRASGITLGGLQKKSSEQMDLFETRKRESLETIYEGVDRLASKYGKHTVFLGSSMEAVTKKSHQGKRGEDHKRIQGLLKGETFRKRIGIPMLGEV